MKFINNLLPLSLILGSLCATDVLAESSDAVHFGKSVSRQQVIDTLAPSRHEWVNPPLLTRGIRLQKKDEEAKAVAAETDEGPRALSLEVYFEFDSAELTPEAMAQLAPVGEALQSEELSGLRFTLEGHTDASGPESYNLTLSERRALAVKQWFSQQYTLETDRLEALGKGEAELIAGTPPTSGVHRRVTIIAE